jgi:CHAT domain-containing protein
LPSAPRPSFSDSNAGGLLQVREIARLSLDTDLVTISACNTGTGKLEGEEGSTGLVQAFLFAGARAVAASLWPVDDASTEFLTKQFYTHLAERDDEAVARSVAVVLSSTWRSCTDVLLDKSGL